MAAENPFEQLEARLAALEEEVKRLSNIVNPAFSVSNITAAVAGPMLKETAQHQFNARFFALLDIGEASLKYSAGIAFAWSINKGHAQANDVMEMFKQFPSFGKWAEMLRRILDDPSNTGWPVDIVRAAFKSPDGKPTAIARYLLDEFISLRNKERGHGAQQPEGHYESLYRGNTLIIQDCVAALRHLEIPLVYVHAADNLTNKCAYKTIRLMGAAPTSSAEPIVTTVKVAVGSTCLWDGSDSLLPLGGFITHRYCPTCGLEHMFFAERITADKLSCHSYVGGHRLTISLNPK